MNLKPFEQIIAEHGPTILRVCRATLDPHDAEDAWSETFLSALRAYPELRPDSNIRAWLITIARRKAIDQHRLRARNPTSTEDLPELPSCRTRPARENAGLWSALKSLPTRQREAVAYHYLAGMSYAEIATLLGGTEIAARRAAADGIKKLRATLQGVPK